MTQERRRARPPVRLVDRVQRAVDGGVNRAEKIHKRVASFPLEVMEQLELFSATVKDLNRMQDRSIGAAYDIARGINHDVIRIVKQILRPRRAKARAQPRKKAKKPVKAAAKVVKEATEAHQAA